MLLETKNKKIKFFALIIKLMITAFALYYILFQVKYQIKSSQITSFILNSPHDIRKILILVLVSSLMFFNWFIEGFKWKLLISKVEKVDFVMALKSVLIGLSVGILTPSRIGEFGGKIFFLKKAERIRAFFIAMLGSLSQLFATITFGSIGLIYYLYIFMDYGLWLTITLGIFFSILFFFLLGGFSKISFLGKNNFVLNMLGKYHRYFLIFKSYNRSELLFVIFLSCLRYAIFSSQFYLLLLFFDVQVDLVPAWMLISLSYLVLSVIPTIALADIGVRGAVSVYFLGLLSNNSVGIVSASILLWFINLAIPAFIGCLFIYQLRFYRESKFESL